MENRFREVKEYSELEAVTGFYQFKHMDAATHYRSKQTKVAKNERDRLYNIYIEKLRNLETIQSNMENDEVFWVLVDNYRYANKDFLLNIDAEFQLN